MNHIATLTIIYYKEVESYSYRYDDKNGNTNENGMFPTLSEALGDAAINLKTFTYIGIEEE